MKLEGCCLHQPDPFPRIPTAALRSYRTPARRTHFLLKTRWVHRAESGSAEAGMVEEASLPVTDMASRQLPWWRSPYDRQILRFALPVLLSNLALPISYAVDTGVVGRLGAAQLSGVAVATAALTILNALLSFVGILVAPQVAMKLAENKKDEVSIYLSRNLWFCWLFGLSMMMAIMFNVEGIVNFLRPAAEVRPYVIRYMRLVAPVMPGYLTFLCCSSALRGMKDSTSILIANLVNCTTNIVLDIVLVFGCGMGVIGAGLATIIGVYLANIVMLAKLIFKGPLKFADLRRIPNPLTFVDILKQGTQLSVRSFLFTALLGTTSSLLAQKGAVTHAAYEICRLTSMMIYFVYASLEQTVQSLAASYLGSRDFKSARGVILRTMQMASGLVLVVSVVIFVFSRPYAGIFTKSPEVVSEFIPAAATLLLQPLTATVSIIDGALIGALKTRVTALSQATSYASGMLCIVAMYWIGDLNVLNAFLIIRFATMMGVVATGRYLFSAKSSPYGFKLLN